MKTKSYLTIVVILSIGLFSLASCNKKHSKCQCIFQNGDNSTYDMKGVDHMEDSCSVLDQDAELHQGNCFLK
jgi:hypothetical protein